jgi:hypothetical protein
VLAIRSSRDTERPCCAPARRDSAGPRTAFALHPRCTGLAQSAGCRPLTEILARKRARRAELTRPVSQRFRPAPRRRPRSAVPCDTTDPCSRLTLAIWMLARRSKKTPDRYLAMRRLRRLCSLQAHTQRSSKNHARQTNLGSANNQFEHLGGGVWESSSR